MTVVVTVLTSRSTWLDDDESLLLLLLLLDVPLNARASELLAGRDGRLLCRRKIVLKRKEKTLVGCWASLGWTTKAPITIKNNNHFMMIHCWVSKLPVGNWFGCFLFLFESVQETVKMKCTLDGRSEPNGLGWLDALGSYLYIFTWMVVVLVVTNQPTTFSLHTGCFSHWPDEAYCFWYTSRWLYTHRQRKRHTHTYFECSP